MEKKIDTKNTVFSSGFRGITEILAIFLTLLLPLKFSSLATMPEVPAIYSDNILFWIIGLWPLFLFPLLSGGLLAIVFLQSVPGNNFAFKTVMLWVGLAFVSLLGIINASCFDYPFYQIIHMFSIASFALAILIILNRNPNLKIYFITAVILGTILSALWGIQQLTGGLDDTQNYVYKMEADSGVKVSSRMLSRIKERRVFSTFAICNSFAAHLILTIPLCLWGAWQAGKKIHPPKTSKILFISLTAILLFSMLYYTRSRAAILALGLAVLLLIPLLPYPRKLRISVLILFPILIGTGFIVFHYWGGLKSMMFRLDYFKAAGKMFMKHPFFGTGWGDFFHEYTKLKSLANDEAPHTPHNLVLAFASQAGITGLLLSIAALLYPVYAGIRKIYRNSPKYLPLSLELCVIIGWLAWALHSLSDIDLQVPGSVCTALIMVIIIGMPSDNTKEETTVTGSKYVFFKILWSGLCILIIVICVISGIRGIKGEMAYYKLQQLCRTFGKSQEEQAQVSIPQVEQARIECEKYFPWSPLPWSLTADFLASRNDFGNAEKYYLKAISLSPERASLYFRLYILQNFTEKYDEAHKNRLKAQELFPLNPKYKNNR
jgi:tetratricopeptide (TPR) repeat protein